MPKTKKVTTKKETAPVKKERVTKAAVVKETKVTKAASTRKPKAVVIEETVIETEMPTTSTTRKPVNVRRLIVIAIIMAVLIGIIIAVYKYLVIAWVDSKPITRMSYYQQLEGKYGEEIKDQLITESLIESEAKRRNVVVGAEEVDAELKKVEDQQGGADKLAQILQIQGISMEEVRKQLQYQLLIKKMFGQNVTVSDEELNAYLDSNKDRFPEMTDAIKAEVREQLKLQKISQDFSTWLNEAKSSDRIVRL